ncbi:MAG: hypothetical protein JXQ93_09555 [Flavobacteriaceae bacterium]
MIQGTITSDSVFVKNVHIINISSNKGTITLENGSFEIPVKIGDTLTYSHLNYIILNTIISKEDIQRKKILLKAENNTHKLDEIILNKTSIFSLDKEIFVDKGPEINAETLRLPFAATKKKKNKAIIRANSGVSFNLIGIINTINGKRKRMKKLKTLLQEDAILKEIRSRFLEDFFIFDLKLKKEQIYPFLIFCKNNHDLNSFRLKNKLDLIAIFLIESKEFKALQADYKDETPKKE